MIGKIRPVPAPKEPAITPAECPRCGSVRVVAGLFSAAGEPVAGHCPDCGDMIVFDAPEPGYAGG